jgi:hypothetical protein
LTSLRWTIGIVTTLVTIAWIAFSALAGGFRRSFGASENSPLLSIVVIAAAALIVSSVIWPERRMLLHVTAVAMLALSVGCLYLTREAPFVATLGLMYAGLWLLYYYRTAWR